MIIVATTSLPAVYHLNADCWNATRSCQKGGKKKRKEKRMSFLVATNIVASRPPERQPTETPHARANRACLNLTYSLPNKVRIIHLSAAPNPFVGPLGKPVK